MTILNDYFYHSTIRKYQAVFGTLFNNVHIVRNDGKDIKVPLATVLQEKQNRRRTEDSDPNTARYKMRLPRMSFGLMGWQKANNRATNRNNRLSSNSFVQGEDTTKTTQYNRVPYDFNFDLNIKTKNIEDMMQIIEQILVSFNPSLMVSVEDNPDLDMTSGINIRLESSQGNFDLAGEYENPSIIETTMSFVLEGWLYMPTQQQGVVTKVNLDFGIIDGDGENIIEESTTITPDDV